MKIDETQILVEDIKFLLAFVPALSRSEVVKGMFSSYYLTGSYEGDVSMIHKVEDIMERHGISSADIGCP